MAQLPTIGIVIGSLQANGLSRKLGNGVRQLGSDRLMLEIIEIGDLSLYHPDRDDGTVPAWQAFR